MASSGRDLNYRKKWKPQLAHAYFKIAGGTEMCCVEGGFVLQNDAILKFIPRTVDGSCDRHE
jgi:hypothetical protein